MKQNEYQGMMACCSRGGLYLYWFEQRDYMVDILKQAMAVVQSHDVQNILHPEDIYTVTEV